MKRPMRMRVLLAQLREEVYELTAAADEDGVDGETRSTILTELLVVERQLERLAGLVPGPRWGRRR